MSIAPSGTNENGDRIYTITLTNGETSTIIAPKGDKGACGVQAATAGMFTFEVEENGDLYVNFVDQGETPQFEYDTDTGDLYYIIP